MRSPAGVGSWARRAPEARRGHRRRAACRRSPLVVELGEVGGEGCILEPPAGEVGGEAAERPGVRPAGVRGEGGLGEAAGGRRRAIEGGGTGRGDRRRRRERQERPGRPELTRALAPASELGGPGSPRPCDERPPTRWPGAGGSRTAPAHVQPQHEQQAGQQREGCRRQRPARGWPR